MLSLNPLVWSLDKVSQWVDQGLAQVSQRLFQQIVFVPVQWNVVATHLYRSNLVLSMGALTLVFTWTVLRMMWPTGPLLGHPARSAPLQRTVSAAIVAIGASPAVHGLLTINDALVRVFVDRVGSASVVGSTHFELSVNPLLALVLGALVLALLIYLGLFYALRTVEIYVLTGLIPWFAVLWSGGADDTWLSNIGKELMVAIFVQSVHAMVFWIFLHLVTHTTTLADEFLQAGVLWYMTKIPGQLRRLVGAQSNPARLLAWI